MPWFIRREVYVPEHRTDLIRTPDGKVREFRTEQDASAEAATLREADRSPDVSYAVIGTD
jgi:hypothetical protein